jgi:hypothetical protein
MERSADVRDPAQLPEPAALTLDPSRDYQPTGRDRYARWHR